MSEVVESRFRDTGRIAERLPTAGIKVPLTQKASSPIRKYPGCWMWNDWRLGAMAAQGSEYESRERNLPAARFGLRRLYEDFSSSLGERPLNLESARV
jgi:hypothetical protein